MADVRKKARELSLNAHGMQKPGLIRAIQTVCIRDIIRGTYD